MTKYRIVWSETEQLETFVNAKDKQEAIKKFNNADNEVLDNTDGLCVTQIHDIESVEEVD